MDNILTFIHSLDLDTTDTTFSFPQRLRASANAADNENAYLNFKSLQSFVSNITTQHQEDVLNSLLLAQRVASKAFPDNKQLMDWYGSYFNVLSKLGWVFEDSGFNDYKIKHSTFDIYTAILEILTASLSGNLLEIAKKTIDAFRSLEDKDSRIRAFEEFTTSATKGNFQIGVANDEGGVLSISLCAFVLSSQHDVRRILFFKSDKKSVDFQYQVSMASLNESIFTDNIRKAIKDKLGDIAGYITDLDI